MKNKINNKKGDASFKLAENAKQLVITAKEKEEIRLKLVETAKEKEVTRVELVKVAKRLAITAKEKEYIRIKLAVVAKEKESVRKKLVVADKRLAVTAKEKEATRAQLAKTAGQLATTAEEKESVRLKLAKTAKQLAITAKEKEDIRIKLAVATDEKLLIAEKFAVLGRLVGIVSHELRNPLGVIRNSIYFLTVILKEGADEKVKNHLGIINIEIGKCNKIISDSLDFARTKPPAAETAEINGVVSGILSEVNIPKTITVETKLGENLPKINIDITQIKQVFRNLISNAVEAMPEGGKLRITTSQADAFIFIAFKDTGVGISKENMNKLFKPLFSTKIKGLGLGLSACKNIIDAHHGKIECESKAGQGATFIIKLPIVQNVNTGRKNNK